MLGPSLASLNDVFQSLFNLFLQLLPGLYKWNLSGAASSSTKLQVVVLLQEGKAKETRSTSSHLYVVTGTSTHS